MDLWRKEEEWCRETLVPRPLTHTVICKNPDWQKFLAQGRRENPPRQKDRR